MRLASLRARGVALGAGKRIHFFTGGRGAGWWRGLRMSAVSARLVASLLIGEL